MPHPLTHTTVAITTPTCHARHARHVLIEVLDPIVIGFRGRIGTPR
jgi:hypothetical protein